MTRIWRHLRSTPELVVAGVGVLVILVAMLWLPFGLKVGFVGDGWILFHQVDAGNPMSATTATRLFTPVPYMIAYSLTPGQFTGVNLLLALLMAAKGGLLIAILRRLGAPSPLAFGAAALAILLPADSGVFYLGAVTIEFVLVGFLLAVYLLLVYWQQRSLVALVAMSLVHILTVGIYEGIYPLIAVTPLLLLIHERRISRRWLRVALFWYLVPAINAVWYLFVVTNFPRAFQYQGSIAQHPTLALIGESLLKIYKRHFFDGWVEHLASIAPRDWLLGGLAGLLVLSVGWWLGRNAPVNRRLTWRLALAGLVIMLLGVALYLPTAARDQTVRTYYFSSVGAAITLAALGWSTGRRLIFAALMGVLALVGMAQLLNQHQRYFDQSEQEQAMLTAFARAVPQIAPGTGIVIIDASPEADYTRITGGALYTEYTLPTLYDDYSLGATLCGPEEVGTGADKHCRLTDEGMTIPSVRSFWFTRTYDQLIFVRYDGQFQVIDDLTPYTGKPIPAYQPQKRYQANGLPPPRITTLFGS